MDARPGSSGKDDPAPSPVRLDPLHHATTAETVYAILAQAAADVNEDWCIDEHAALAAELSDLTAFSAMPIVNDPLTRTEALNSSTAPQWAAAMQSEYDSLINAKTYTLIPRPPHCRPIDCKWVLKTKRNAQGVLIKHKARLVARGYAQRYGVDYEETYAPVCRQGSIRMLCALAAQHDWEIHQMDVVSAFLNGVLEETVYMEQPEGFVIPGKEDWVCKLSKSLYGLKQAGRTWYQKIDVTLKQTHGFSALSTDQCVYIRKDKTSLIIIALYVDDLLIFSNSIPALTSFKQTLTTEFAMQDLGEASLILGIEISRNRAARTLSLSQSGYVRDLLKRHDMGECNAVLTPVEKGVVQRKSVEDYVAAAEMTKRYQSIVGAVNQSLEPSCTPCAALGLTSPSPSAHSASTPATPTSCTGVACSICSATSRAPLTTSSPIKGQAPSPPPRSSMATVTPTTEVTSMDAAQQLGMCFSCVVRPSAGSPRNRRPWPCHPVSPNTWPWPLLSRRSSGSAL